MAGVAFVVSNAIVTDDVSNQAYVIVQLLLCRKFDIGIYVTITSIDPLLVYSYEGDWLIR